MKTALQINENYTIIERKVYNERPIPNKLLDLIIPLMQGATNREKKRKRALNACKNETACGL